MNTLSRILGFIDGSVDLGAITGIFGRIADLVKRVPELITRARALAKKFRGDPELRQFFDDVQDLIGDIPGLLRLDSGEVITPEQIAAARKHWQDIGDQQVHDLPAAPPPPPPPPTGGKFTDYDKPLSAAPNKLLLVSGRDRIFVDRLDSPTIWIVWNPDSGTPPPRGWLPVADSDQP